jgi:hypothetical protein
MDETSVCSCGSTRVVRRRNAGWDCWPGGEEAKHEDKCLECGATRIVCDWSEFDEAGEFSTGTSHGKWNVWDKVFNDKTEGL